MGYTTPRVVDGGRLVDGGRRGEHLCLQLTKPHWTQLMMSLRWEVEGRLEQRLEQRL